MLVQVNAMEPIIEESSPTMSPAHHAGAAAAAEAAALAAPALADELIDTVVVTAAPADEPIATAVATAAPADEPIATAAAAATSDARICDLCGEVSPNSAWHMCATDCPRRLEDYDWVTCEMCQEVSPDRGWGNCAAGCPRITDCLQDGWQGLLNGDGAVRRAANPAPPHPLRGSGCLLGMQFDVSGQLGVALSSMWRKLDHELWQGHETLA